MSKLPRMQSVLTDTPTEFFGRCREHEIHVWKEDDEPWYIQVTAPDGGYVYDGWWRHSEDASREAAIREALVGAQLING